MIDTVGFAVKSPSAAPELFRFQRRDLGPDDVLIDIDYCGICHTDIHHARNKWGDAIYPMVVGHEIVGRVKDVGSAVTEFKQGERVGVGCLSNSCGSCPNCLAGEEQYCSKHTVWTYNSTEADGVTPTYGGYSKHIVINRHFVLRIPENLNPAAAAPLLGAGIGAWSPLRHWGVGRGYIIAIIGLGGVGHLAVKLASSLGAEVTVLSTDYSKAEDAAALGARHFVDIRSGELPGLRDKFDFVMNCSAYDIDITPYLETLKVDGSMVLVGNARQTAALYFNSLISRRRTVSGSLAGGIEETQKMLNYCGENNITADIELVPLNEVGEAWKRIQRGNARYRYVADVAGFKE